MAFRAGATVMNIVYTCTYISHKLMKDSEKYVNKFTSPSENTKSIKEGVHKWYNSNKPESSSHKMNNGYW